jgi:WD40 repeat protein
MAYAGIVDGAAKGERPRAGAVPRSSGVDLYGDPLPAGAAARLGTVRLRRSGFGSAYVAFGRFGRELFETERDGLIRVWDPVTGKELRRIDLQVRSWWVFGLAICANGKVAAYGGKEGIYLFDVASGSMTRTIPLEPTSDILSLALALSPDGRRLAASIEAQGDQQDRVYPTNIWSTGDGRVLYKLDDHYGTASYLAFTADGKTLLSIHGEKTILFSDAATGREMRHVSIDWPPNRLGAASLSADGRLLAIANSRWNTANKAECSIRLWDIATAREIGNIPTPEMSIQTIAFAPEGTRLASVEYETLRVREVKSGSECLRIPIRVGMANRLAFSPDGKLLAATGSDHTIHLWNARTGQDAFPCDAHESFVNAIAYSPDGKTVATSGGNDRSVRLWDATSGRQRCVVRGRHWGSFVLLFSCDGSLLFFDGGDNALRRSDARTGEEQRKYVIETKFDAEHMIHSAHAAALSLDGTRLYASSGNAATVALDVDCRTTAWDVRTGIRLWQRKDQLDRTGAYFSPDARVLINGEGRVMDLTTAEFLFRLQDPNTEKTYDLVFSQDGRLVLTRSFENRRGTPKRIRAVQLFEVASGKEILRFDVEDRCDSLALLFGGRFAATSGGEHLRLIDLRTGDTVVERFRDRGWSMRLVPSPDNRFLADALTDSTVLIWDISKGLPAAQASQAGGPPRSVLWEDLASADLRRAYEAVWELELRRDSAVAFLASRLRPDEGISSDRIRRLREALNGSRFAVREKASRELSTLGPDARPALKRALQTENSNEVRKRLEAILAQPAGPMLDPSTLRNLRSIQVLEQIGTPAARRLLEKMCLGNAEARATQEAKATSERLRPRTRH